MKRVAAKTLAADSNERYVAVQCSGNSCLDLSGGWRPLSGATGQRIGRKTPLTIVIDGSFFLSTGLLRCLPKRQATLHVCAQGPNGSNFFNKK